MIAAGLVVKNIPSCCSVFVVRTMKLLTHNMLTSKSIKGVKEGYPLQLKVEDMEVKETEFNKDFVARIIPKIRYDALRSAVKDVGKEDALPAELPDDAANSEDFLRKFHHVLLELEILKGELICPETGRVFPIQNGIPNMLLKPEEVS
ncbi:multifunctional methyltransferase subunit TRM112-like protein isoform X2 [Paramacrobiotus metropolitanus]|uniref:multifunctional methyltransferase subunit TRM112-like protein isoform X2 n=1 Tax=Paramacrobiotus metropolitanus TaxID=2943436 RepID=UPI002445BC08|nr:multifunctional methyltransferase subunit TRM112-like protein isoform X2 [Paramacrobiotus metropolitanus]